MNGLNGFTISMKSKEKLKMKALKAFILLKGSRKPRNNIGATPIDLQ